MGGVGEANLSTRSLFFQIFNGKYLFLLKTSGHSGLMLFAPPHPPASPAPFLRPPAPSAPPGVCEGLLIATKTQN